jgi:hypothetical protein
MGSFYDSVLVTTLHIVDYRVTREDDVYMGTNILALSGIRTYGLRVQDIKDYVSDRAVTGTGLKNIIRYN